MLKFLKFGVLLSCVIVVIYSKGVSLNPKIDFEHDWKNSVEPSGFGIFNQSNGVDFQPNKHHHFYSNNSKIKNRRIRRQSGRTKCLVDHLEPMTQTQLCSEYSAGRLTAILFTELCDQDRNEIVLTEKEKWKRIYRKCCVLGLPNRCHTNDTAWREIVLSAFYLVNYGR